jgi:hypothetical protein
MVRCADGGGRAIGDQRQKPRGGRVERKNAVLGAVHGDAHLLYGEWLRRGNRRVDAREQLRAAHEMFITMGTHAFAERARNELLVTGKTVRKRTPDSFDELAPQEALVARLASDGRTNPEIGAQLLEALPRQVRASQEPSSRMRRPTFERFGQAAV